MDTKLPDFECVPIIFEHKVILTADENNIMYDFNKMVIRIKCNADSLKTLNENISTWAKQRALHYEPKTWTNVYLIDTSKPKGMYLDPYIEDRKTFMKGKIEHNMYITFECTPHITVMNDKVNLKFFCIRTLYAHYSGVLTPPEPPRCMGVAI